MKLNTTFLSLGILISAILLKYTSIQANYLLVAGAIIFVVSLVLLSLNRNTDKVSSSHNSSEYSTSPVIHDSVNGTVKWFNKTKGFGFITQENGEDVFVHQTSIAFKPNILREGQAVTLSIVMDKKGPQAENVRKRA